MLFRAVQNGLCAMAEKKSSPEKNEVPAPCPPCPPVSRSGEGREGIVGEGRLDHGQWPCQRGCSLEALQPLGTEEPRTWNRPTMNSTVTLGMLFNLLELQFPHSRIHLASSC